MRSLLPFAVLASLFVISPRGLAQDAQNTTVLPGENISEAEIRGLLAKILEMQTKQDAADRAILTEAIRTLGGGMAGPTEAIGVHITSVRVVDFEKTGKKQVDFDEWKKKNDDKLHDSAFGQALSLQYTYLKLAIEADTEEKRRAVAPKLVMLADEYIKVIPKLGGYAKVLSDDAFSLPVSARFGLSKRKPEGWPGSPLNLSGVYSVLLKSARIEAPKTLPSLWESRIKQERTLYLVRENAAKLAARKTADAFGKKTKGESSKSDPADSSGEKFDTVILPKLQWEMGEDFYRSGLRRRGIECQFGVLVKNPEHPSRAEWLKSIAEKASGVASESGVPVPESGAKPASNSPAVPSAVPAPAASSAGGEAPLPPV